MISYFKERFQERKAISENHQRREQLVSRMMHSYDYHQINENIMVYTKANRTIKFIVGDELKASDIHITFLQDGKPHEHSVRHYYDQYQCSLGVPYEFNDEKPFEVFDELYHFFMRNFEDFENEDFCMRMTLAYLTRVE